MILTTKINECQKINIVAVILLKFVSRDMKVVIVGDAAVGKTCLLHRYLHGEFFDQSPNVSFSQR